MRELIEINCNDCNGFFTVNLNLGLDGDFLIECPNCGRKHPRRVNRGDVKSPWNDRIYKNGEGKRITRKNTSDEGELIQVPLSAYSKESRLKKIESGGFLASKWLKLVGEPALGRDEIGETT